MTPMPRLTADPIARACRAVTESLEARRLLAAPELAAAPFDLDVPAGQALFVPLVADDADGDAVSFTAAVTGGADADEVDLEVLSQDNTYLAMQTRDFGTMLFQLFDGFAPETVDRISGLADSGYYDGLRIFRSIDGFIIQFGDPTENNNNPNPIRDRVEFSFDDEFDPDNVFTGFGQMAMANSGKDTNSSQFFVTDSDGGPLPGPDGELDTDDDEVADPPAFLNGNHTVFGQLLTGFPILDAITAQPVNGDLLENPIVVEQVRTVEVDDASTLRVLPSASLDADAELEITVTATDSNGETDTRSYTVGVNEVDDAANVPAILQPFASNLTTDAGQAVTFGVPAVDAEGDPIDYEASFTQLFGATSDPTLTEDEVGTLGVDDSAGTVTFTPAPGFTGQAEFFVYARTEGATSRGSTASPYDSQLVTIGVGDEPITGTSRTVNALPGVPLQDAVVATFTDGDPDGSADDFTASIDWGDGTVDQTGDDGGNDVVVRPSADQPGVFEVVGTHTYANGAVGLPVFVTVLGDDGAQIRVQSVADVQSAGTIETVTVQDENGDDVELNVLTVNGTSGADTILIGFDGTQVSVNVDGQIERFAPGEVDLIEVFGREGDDIITMEDDAPAVRVFAGAGDDTVRGGLNDDEIFGQAGDDVLDGFGGNDLIDAGEGDDYVMGGTGIDYDDEDVAAGFYDRDTILGGPGNDTLSGGLDANEIDGGDGDDLLNGSGSRDSLDGGAGNDLLRGFGNGDLLLGGDGNDLLDGDADDDDRFGERAGDFDDLDDGDTLEGGNGNDVLRGFFDDDLFRGGAGDDALFGGDGTDTAEDVDSGDVLDSIENVGDDDDDLA